MAQKPPWTPWHRVVRLREDVRTGELSLADFAADLHDVATQKGARPVYEDPGRFFALTYPTFPLRELARDVALRLAGKNTKAIRQLELTYGGGKTHTLVTLYHLTHEPESLPALPAVAQFRSHIMNRYRIHLSVHEQVSNPKLHRGSRLHCPVDGRGIEAAECNGGETNPLTNSSPGLIGRKSPPATL